MKDNFAMAGLTSQFANVKTIIFHPHIQASGKIRKQKNCAGEHDEQGDKNGKYTS
jgi:hypothetical protein